MLEHLFQMGGMVDLFSGLNDHVVYVDFKHVVYLIRKDFVHHVLVCSAHVLQAERHYVLVIIARLDHESGIFFVCFCHGNLVVTRLCVHER